MFWADELARRLDAGAPQVVNDSKTPSGMVPISALRGPILHDAIYRAMRDAGLEATYRFGIDDMDPMDSQSMRSNEALAPHMGRPLFTIPPPEPDAASYAELHASRFLATFAALGIRPTLYRTAELYREGQFDRSIDLVLRHADVVRDILKRVSNVDHGPDYHALHVLCQSCGRIGTTRVTGYDGREVSYECRRDLVKWAEGCGHRGTTSPFGGRAKLPYVEEWCAKWDLFGVTVEGCGKDLATAGGARARSDALYRAIWQKEPPVNVPYEYVTVGGGRKMSTSHAAAWHEMGAAAHEIVELLTPEIVRFFMLRPRPGSHVEFDPTGDRVPRLFDEYDRAAEAFAAEPDSDLGRVYALAQLGEARAGYRVPFSLLANWLQIPAIDPQAAAVERAGRALDDWERRELARRREVARVWLERWAPDEARFSVTASLPEVARSLTASQRELLRRLGEALSNGAAAEDIQTRLYEMGRELGLPSKDTFAAVYLAFIGKPHGPRAGWLLASLDREFARRRLEEAATA